MGISEVLSNDHLLVGARQSLCIGLSAVAMKLHTGVSYFSHLLEITLFKGPGNYVMSATVNIS